MGFARQGDASLQPNEDQPSSHQPANRQAGACESGPLAGLERLQLIMGWQCNVRCSMCYQTDFSPKSNMSADIYAGRLLDAYPHVRLVKLQGGEPTIMKNCRDAAQLLRGFPNVRLELVTNGVHVDTFWLRTFMEQTHCVSYSINAATPGVYDSIVRFGDFDQVVTNIGRLTTQRRGPTPIVGVSAVILKENFHELHRIVVLASDLGADYVEFLVDPILSFSGLPPRTEVVAELERCRDAAAKAGITTEGLSVFRRRFDTTRGDGAHDGGGMCSMPFRNVVIDPDGAVRVCCNSWVKIGNLSTSSLLDLWEESNLAGQFRRMMMDGNYLWCSPNCSDNIHPSRLSLLHKYWYEFRDNPATCMRKVEHKLLQLRKTGLAGPALPGRPAA